VAGCGWLLASGCAMSAPPAADTLAAGAAAPAEAAAGAVDAEARAAVAALDAGAGDVASLRRGMRALFAAAELRLQRGVAAWLVARPAAKLPEVLAADDAVGDDVRQDVVSLCERGLECADRLLGSAPEDVDAMLHRGSHLSLLAWAKGPARALLAGYGPKLAAAIEAAVAVDPAFDGASPLRLLGRFRSRAPWPYGDLSAARKALARAVELAPFVVNHLFYGDALAAAGELAAAREQWDLATTAGCDATTSASAPLLREQAAARLRASLVRD
jgi:hypothetical protein